MKAPFPRSLSWKSPTKNPSKANDKLLKSLPVKLSTIYGNLLHQYLKKKKNDMLFVGKVKGNPIKSRNWIICMKKKKRNIWNWIKRKKNKAGNTWAISFSCFQKWWTFSSPEKLVFRVSKSTYVEVWQLFN